MKRVVVLDYGSGNVHSAVRMLERIGAAVELSADADAVARADGLFVPGVGNFHACAAGLAAAQGPQLVRARLEDDAPVLGICVGMQVMFDGSTEKSAEPTPGLGLWRGEVERLEAPVVPHMGWSNVTPGEGSTLFSGVADERFYFVHSYAAPAECAQGNPESIATTATHGRSFLAAMERGALSATQFHPEKSGDAGAQLLTNWLQSL